MRAEHIDKTGYRTNNLNHHIYEVRVHNLDYDRDQCITIRANSVEQAAQMVMADYSKNSVWVRLLGVEFVKYDD